MIKRSRRIRKNRIDFRAAGQEYADAACLTIAGGNGKSEEPAEIQTPEDDECYDIEEIFADFCNPDFDYGQYDEKIEDIEDSIQDLSDKVQEISNNQEEAFNRISVSIVDSQLALKNSDHSLHEIKRFSRESHEYMCKMDDRLIAFENEIENSASPASEVRQMKTTIEEMQNRFANLEEILRNGNFTPGESIKKAISDYEEDFFQKVCRLTKELESSFSVRLSSLEKRFEEINEKIASKVRERNEKIDGLRNEISKSQSESNPKTVDPSEIIETFEDRINNLRMEVFQGIEPAVNNLRDFSNDKISGFQIDLNRQDSRLAKIESKIEEAFKQIPDEIENRLNKIGERLSSFEENHDKRYNNVVISTNEQITEQNAAIEKRLNDFNESIKSLKFYADEIKAGFGDEIEERFRPINKTIEDLTENVRLNVLPLKEEITDIKILVEKEMNKVKESREKLDKAISDSEGAMEMARSAKETLARIESEISEALSKVDSLMATIRESDLKTQSNFEKINLTIKLIDEARERIKGFSMPAAQIQSGQTVNSALSAMDNLFLTQKEIIEDPDLSEIGFDLEDLLQVMIKHEASDLHLKAGSPPTVRLEGELIPVGSQILQEEDCKKLILSAMTPPLRGQLAKREEVDFSYVTPAARFRANAFLQNGSISAAFRLRWTDVPSTEALYLPPVLKNLCDHNHGLILITGPAGSGKSTTLSAMINHINENKKLHVITIEDPIEFLHKDKQSMITQREVGTDTESFSVALRQALRQDPNVILIGEMRDPETIMTAAMAAETGHLVLSTLHTPNTVQAISRILDVFSGESQKQFSLLLSQVLRGIISQRLLVRADGTGRVPAIEVLVVTPTISSLILDGKVGDIYHHITQGKLDGMQTFTQSLVSLYERGLITKEEALSHADQPTEFRMAIEGHTTGTSATISDDSLMSWL